MKIVAAILVVLAATFGHVSSVAAQAAPPAPPVLTVGPGQEFAVTFDQKSLKTLEEIENSIAAINKRLGNIELSEDGSALRWLVFALIVAVIANFVLTAMMFRRLNRPVVTRPSHVDPVVAARPQILSFRVAEIRLLDSGGAQLDLYKTDPRQT